MAHERRDDPKSSASSSHRSRHAPADMDEEVDPEQQRLYEERRYDSMYKLLYPRADRLRPVSKIWDDQDRLAKKLVQDGLPDIVRATPNNLPGRPSLRPKLWKLVLGVEDLGVQDYLSYVSRGPSAVSSKIRNDTFRTLATDKQFKGKVNEEMLIRLLDAFVWKNEDRNRNGHGLPFTYVQGMNVLAAPFLYAMPTEIEAFACFSAFIEKCCPLYVQPTLVGVHSGLELMDKCLERMHKPLYDHLRSKNLSAEIYAFPSVLTLCACTPPLDEVLKLWDFLLTCGVHLNIICVVAQLLLIDDHLLNHPSPMKVLRNFPPLQARRIIEIIVALTDKLDDELYDALVRHPFQR